MTPTRLSVNVNKYALVRNSRGRDLPHLPTIIDTVLSAGAHGITVHPRMDQRHIRRDDLPIIQRHLQTHHPGVELNMECEDHPTLIDIAIELRPAQVTLVPVTPGETTSDHGWSLPGDTQRLVPTIRRLKQAGIRVSLFADADPENMTAFVETETDCVELYTGPYAWAWGTEQQARHIDRIHECGQRAAEAGLRVHAGHDLDRHNLAGIGRAPWLTEVSIGHALVCRALEVGTIQAVQELLDPLTR